MSKAKRTLYFLLSLMVYLAIIFLPMHIVPMIVDLSLSFFTVSEPNYSMIASLIVATIFFIISSDKVYVSLHQRYIQWMENTNASIVKALLVALISANDVLVAIPKRTVLFGFYLLYSILDKLGCVNLNVDAVFVGVFIIGIDRIAKSWKDEKKKLFALGRKAYSKDNTIADSVVTHTSSIQHDK